MVNFLWGFALIEGPDNLLEENSGALNTDIP